MDENLMAEDVDNTLHFKGFEKAYYIQFIFEPIIINEFTFSKLTNNILPRKPIILGVEIFESLFIVVCRSNVIFC